MIQDLTGPTITEVATFPAVIAIASTKVAGEIGQGWTPPMVIIEVLAIDYSPFGRTRRARLQAPIFAAKCYGGTRIQASQLGNAVAEAMELRGPRIKSTGKVFYLSLVTSGGDVVLDPLTKWPYSTVIFTVIGHQFAVAVP
jgi:hypothetical protein